MLNCVYGWLENKLEYRLLKIKSIMFMKELALMYKEFQNSYGQSEKKDFKETIENLFAIKFKKIANGVELVTERDELEKQLASVKVFAGNWIMRENYIIPSADNKQCAIRYILSTDKGGNYDIMAVLSSVDGKKIDLIDEVYYQIQ